LTNVTSCIKISIKLITLLDKNPEAEKSSGDVTLLIAISISTYSSGKKERKKIMRERITLKRKHAGS